MLAQHGKVYQTLVSASAHAPLSCGRVTDTFV
jgi:hypothetical protein